MRLGYRQFATVALAMLLGTLLLPSTGAQTPQPKRGGTLVFGIWTPPRGSIDERDSRHVMAQIFGKNLFDPLARIDPKTAKPVPALAKSWTVSPDGRSITFVLRDDVVFHDGAKFDAEAAKFNLDRFAERGAFSRARFMGGDAYVGTEVLDRYTIRITWRETQGFWWELQDYYLGFSSPAAVRRAGNEYGLKTVTGTGPFKLVEYSEGSGAVMERFDQYRWGATIYKHTGPVYLDRLVFTTIIEPTTRLAALERAEIQYTDGRRLEYALPEIKRKRLTVYHEGTAGTPRTLMLNVTHPPLDEARVRQAISFAIDREALVKGPRYAGVSRPAFATMTFKNWLPGNIQEFRPFNYLHDPAKSNELLDRAGWAMGQGGIRSKDGKRLQFEAVIPAQFIPELEPVQAMLAKVGIEMKIRVVDIPTWFSMMERRQMDATIRNNTGWGLNWGIEEFQCNWQDNPSSFCNPELDNLVTQMYRTLDVAKKRELARRALRIILIAAPAVPIVDEMYTWLSQPYVMDVNYPVDSWPRFYDAWLNR